VLRGRPCSRESFVDGACTVDASAPSDAPLAGGRWQHRFLVGGSDDEVDVGSLPQDQPTSLVPTTFGRGLCPAPFAAKVDGPSGPESDVASTARHLLGVRSGFVSAVATPRAHSVPPNCTGSLSTHDRDSRACMAALTTPALRRVPTRAEVSGFASGPLHATARGSVVVYCAESPSSLATAMGRSGCSKRPCVVERRQALLR
jgi:hypothetical protein